MRKVIFVITIVLFLISCNKKVVKIDLNLSRLNTEAIFKLDTINLNDWDSLHIVKPYNTDNLDRLNIPKPILKEINSTVRTDGTCCLLFIKNDNLVNYSFVPQTVANFASKELEDISILSSDQVYQLDEERSVTIP